MITFLGKTFTNLYQGNIAYPFNKNRSIRFSSGIRSDKNVLSAVNPFTLTVKDDKTLYSVTHIEYVYDNSLNPSLGEVEHARGLEDQHEAQRHQRIEHACQQAAEQGFEERTQHLHALSG